MFVPSNQQSALQCTMRLIFQILLPLPLAQVILVGFPANLAIFIGGRGGTLGHDFQKHTNTNNTSTPGLASNCYDCLHHISGGNERLGEQAGISDRSFPLHPNMPCFALAAPPIFVTFLRIPADIIFRAPDFPYINIYSQRQI